MKKRVLLLGLSIAVLLAFIAWSNPFTFLNALSQADGALVAAAFALSVVAIVLRGLKWNVLAGGRFLTVLHVQNLGIAISNFTPAKAGEPVKALLLKAATGKDVSVSFPTIIIERLLDLLVVFAFAFTTIVFFSVKDYVLLVIGGAVIIAVFAAALVAVLVDRRIGAFVFRLLGRLSSFTISEQFIDTFYHRTSRPSRSRIAASLVLTSVVWILEGLMLFLVLGALHVEAPAVFALVSLIAIALIIAIASFLPGGIGSFEIVLTVLLTTVGVGSAAAAVLLYRFVSFWLSNLAGGVSFIVLSKNVKLGNVLKRVS